MRISFIYHDLRLFLQLHICSNLILNLIIKLGMEEDEQCYEGGSRADLQRGKVGGHMLRSLAPSAVPR